MPDPEADTRGVEPQQQMLDTLRLHDPMMAAMFEYGKRVGRRAAAALDREGEPK